jgi:hypothetical protein
MIYFFRWKYKWFWHKRIVSGHSYAKDQDKMILYHQDGSIEEIPHWKDCAVKLGIDWVLAMKEDMAKKAGQKL